MTSPNTTTGWNATAGSNLTDHSQTLNHSQGESEIGEIMTGDNSVRSFQIERTEYYKTNYDIMVGVRIAGTLGGFFIFVLLTLLYKSKCKKSSREPTPVPLFHGESVHPDLVVLSSNPTVQSLEEVNPMLRHNHHHQHQRLLLDQQPGPSHHNRYQSPKVLLTTAHDSSESSIESELFMSGFHRRESNPSLSKYRIPPIGTSYTKKKNSSAAQQMSLLQQNIDIHVIQPTPTISPSGSANIVHKQSRRKSKTGSREYRPHPSIESDPVAMGTNPLFFLQAESLSIKYMDDTSSENIPTRGSDFDEDDSGESLGSDSVFSFERKPSVFTTDEGDEGDGEVCRVTLTEAHAQVHHRDSYCSSEYESITDYLECHRRRSSSTQTTWSDLRQCLGFGYVTDNPSPQSGAGEDTLAIPRVSGALLTPPNQSNPASNSSSRKQSINSIQDQQFSNLNTNSNSTQSSSVATDTVPSIPTLNQFFNVHTNSSIPISTNTNTGQGKKQTFQTLKKTYSLQCDDEQHLLKK